MEMQKSPETRAVVSYSQIEELCGGHMGIFDSHFSVRPDIGEDISDEARAQRYALSQNLGFAEDFLEAVSGGEEAYRAFVCKGVQENPSVAATMPQLLDYFDDPDAKEAIADHCFNHEYVYNNIDQFIGRVPQEKIDNYLATIVGNLAESEINVQKLGVWIRAGYEDIDKLRELALKGLSNTKHMWALNGGDTFSHYCQDIPGLDTRTDEGAMQVHNRILELIDLIVDKGVVSWDEIQENLITRSDPIYYKSRTKYEGEAGQYATDAHSALGMFMATGRIPEDRQKYTELAQKLASDPSASRRLGYIWGTYARWSNYPLPEGFQAEVVDALVEGTEDPSIRLHAVRYYEKFGQQEKAVEIINRELEKLLQENEISELTKTQLRPYFVDMLLKATILSDEQRDALCLQYARTYVRVYEKLPDQEELWRAPQDDELRRLQIEELKDYNFTSLAYLKLKEIAAYIGTPIEEFTETILSRCDDRYALGGLQKFCSDLAEGNLDLTATKEDLYLAVEKIVHGNLDTLLHEQYVLNDLADTMHYFGREYSIRLLEKVRDVSPELTMELGSRLHDVTGDIQKSFEDLLADDDYYSYKSAAYGLESCARFCDPRLVQGLIEKILETFDPADLVDVAWPLSHHMTPEQLETLDTRIARSPVEYDSWLEFRNRVPYFAQKTPELAMTAATPALQNIAPKTYAHMVRRLHGRIGDKASGRKVLAQYSYPQELAGYLHEIYPAELIASAATGIKAKKERDELKRLEILYIAGRHDRIADLAETEDTQEVVASVLREPFNALGLDPDQVDQLMQHFKADGIDPVPMAMWIEQSLKSRAMSEYMLDFLGHMAKTGSLLEWKKTVPHEFVDALGEDGRAVWFGGRELDVRVAGQPVKMRITHGLDAVYQCGAKPNVNCVHYGYGLNRHGLADLLNPHVAMLEVRNAKGSVQLNTVLRLVGTTEGKPEIMLEPVYDSYNDYFAKKETYLTLTQMLFDFADQVDAAVVLGGSHDMTETYRELIGGYVQTKYHKQARQVVPGTTPFNYDDGAGIYKHARKAKMTSLKPKAAWVG